LSSNIWEVTTICPIEPYFTCKRCLIQWKNSVKLDLIQLIFFLWKKSLSSETVKHHLQMLFHVSYFAVIRLKAVRYISFYLGSFSPVTCQKIFCLNLYSFFMGQKLQKDYWENVASTREGNFFHLNMILTGLYLYKTFRGCGSKLLIGKLCVQ
jgi:hypothetical protein